jgi:hypothetical protein
MRLASFLFCLTNYRSAKVARNRTQGNRFPVFLPLSSVKRGTERGTERVLPRNRAETALARVPERSEGIHSRHTSRRGFKVPFRRSNRASRQARTHTRAHHAHAHARTHTHAHARTRTHTHTRLCVRARTPARTRTPVCTRAYARTPAGARPPAPPRPFHRYPYAPNPRVLV